MNALRTEEFKTGVYHVQVDVYHFLFPEDAPFFVKDYSEYYKGRAYHERSLNSNDGWNVLDVSHL